MVRDFTGHGIGEAFHSGLYVPHYDSPTLDGRDGAGHDLHDRADDHARHHEYDMWDDGWTVVTKDRRWTAQFEHTVVVTEDGYEILTLP